MLIIGSHVSFVEEQLLGCVKQALSYGANTFMFYTGAPENTMRRIISEDLTNMAKVLMKNNNISINNVVCHAPYLINLADNSNISKYEFSINFLKSEMNRCKLLGVSKLVVHPGNYLTLSKEDAINNVINALNEVIKQDDFVTILLETMAGKGTEVCSTIEEVKLTIDGITDKSRIGVCLDTCHLNDSGIDISKIDDYLNNFDSLIGLDKIKCIHINDSKNEIGLKKDRHANIGYGTIGFDNLIRVIYHDKLKHIPKILETPYVEEKPPYRYEIEMIKNKKFDHNIIEKIKEQV